MERLCLCFCPKYHFKHECPGCGSNPIIRDLKKDLVVQRQLFKHFNSVYFWQHPLCPQVELQVYSDAVGGAGSGVFCKGSGALLHGLWLSMSLVLLTV